MRVAFIGAGWYGCHLALICQQQGLDVTIFEKQSLMFAGASAYCQQRLHMGLHYPRHAPTRRMLRDSFDRFMSTYGFLTEPVTPNIYAVSPTQSLMDEDTFAGIMVHDGIPIAPTTDPLISRDVTLWNCQERTFHLPRIREYFMQKLGPCIRFNSPVVDIQLIPTGARIGTEHFDQVIDCTYGQFEAASTQKSEQCISWLYAVEDWQGALTVMDGPFWSLYPFYVQDLTQEPGVTITATSGLSGSRYYTLTHVVHTPMGQPDMRLQAERDVSTWIPEFTQRFRYVGYFTSRKSKPVDDSDGRRPLVITDRPYGLSVCCGKINAIFEAEQQVLAYLASKRKVLVGSTGFVGQQLQVQHWFTDVYHRPDLKLLRGQRVGLMVLAACPGVKYLANQDPESDQAAIDALQADLNHIEADQVICISTVDVLHQGTGNETSTLYSEQPYGKHRRAFECFVQNRYAKTLIVRLPGLFGLGLRKNVIYDLLQGKPVTIDADSTFQWYPIRHLWRDLTHLLKISHQGIYHWVSSPLTVQGLRHIMGVQAVDEILVKAPLVRYQVTSTQGYAYTALHIALELKLFVRQWQQSHRVRVSELAWLPHDDLWCPTFFGLGPPELVPVWRHGGDWSAFWSTTQPQVLAHESAQALWFNLTDVVWYTATGRERAGAHLKRLLDFCPNVRTWVLGSPSSRNQPVALCDLVPWLKDLAQYARARGQTLVLEANPEAYGCHIASTLTAAMEVIDAVDDAGLKLHFDTGCALLDHDQNLQTIPHHVHISEPYLTPLQNSLHHDAYAASLRHYTGPLCLEMKAYGSTKREREWYLTNSLRIVFECYIK